MKKLTAALFFVCLLSLGAAAFILPQKEFSENENRTLKTNNTVSSDVLSGGFMEDIESLMSDQFVLRGFAVKAASALKQAAGRTDVNGAYIGKGRLFQKITEADVGSGGITKFVDRLRNLKSRFPELKLYVMPVPSAGVELPGLMPKFAQMYDADKITAELEKSGGEVVDLREKLKDGSFYYKTDHHWTLSGAYEAYKAWQEAHGRSAKALSDFRPEAVASDFYGTLSSKVIFTGVSPDEIEIIAVPENVSVLCDGKEGSVYDKSALEGKDKYRVFFGGNYGTVKISNPESVSGDRLLILKDSFANCFVPFIIEDYSEILMVDERYAAVSLSELIEQSSVSELAVIMEASGF